MAIRESIHWHVRHYGYRWEEWKVSFKKNKLAWIILMFFASQVIIAAIATIVFVLTGLGLVSQTLVFLIKCYVVYVLLFAVAVSPIIITLVALNKIARAK